MKINRSNRFLLALLVAALPSAALALDIVDDVNIDGTVTIAPSTAPVDSFDFEPSLTGSTLPTTADSPNTNTTLVATVLGTTTEQTEQTTAGGVVAETNGDVTLISQVDNISTLSYLKAVSFEVWNPGSDQPLLEDGVTPNPDYDAAAQPGFPKPGSERQVAGYIDDGGMFVEVGPLITILGDPREGLLDLTAADPTELANLPTTSDDVISGGNLQVGGDANVDGTLSVTGDTTTTGNSAVGGTLAVTGDTTLSNVAASGNSTVGGTLAVTGNTTLSTADIDEAYINYADITEADIDEAYINYASITEADIETANIETANIETANIETANVGTLGVSGNATIAGNLSVNGINVNGERIQNVGSPIALTDAVNKNYVDAADTAIRNEFRAADTAIRNDFQAADRRLQGQINSNRTQIDKNTRGIAMVAAMTNSTVLPGKTQVLDFNLSQFDDATGFAFGYGYRVNECLQINAAGASTTDFDEAVARLGVSFQW